MKSLTAKFLVFIILPVMLVLIALSATSYFVARNLLIEQIKLSGQFFLRASAGEISSRIRQVQSMLRLLAATENLASDDAQRRKLFITLKEQLGGSVTSVFMGFDDGRFIRAKTTPLPEGFDPRIRPWYLDALKLPPGKESGVTAPYQDSSTQRPTITLYHKVAAPNGELVGVLGVDIDIAQASASINMTDPFTEDGDYILANSDAVILFHPETDRVGTIIGATGEALDLQLASDIKNPDIGHEQYVGRRLNGQWYLGFSRTENAPLAVVLSVPAKALLTPLLQLTFQMSILGMSIFVFLFLLLRSVTRKISTPIIELNRSAVHVTNGGAYAEPIEVKSTDEVGQLTRAFNEMMTGLRQRDFIRDTFGRYVTREVVEELLDTSGGLEFGGETREVTLVFSDLRGFTPLCEHLSPQQVIEVLNRYLGRMSTIVAKHKGTINEFIGDAILTIFGAPIKHGDSPVRAVACALEMQLAMETVNAENVAKGLPLLSMGIGINTGEVIVGNIGSEARAKYGVVGHHINLASRVQGAAIGGQVLITPATFELVKDFVITRAIFPIQFKGVEHEIDLYDVIGMKSPWDLKLPEAVTK